MSSSFDTVQTYSGSAPHAEDADSSSSLAFITGPPERQRDPAEEQTIRQVLDFLVAQLQKVLGPSAEQISPRIVREEQFPTRNSRRLIDDLPHDARTQPKIHLLLAAFAGGRHGVGVYWNTAAFARQEHVASPAFEQLHLHDQDTHVALKDLARCASGKLVQVSDAEQAADGSCLHNLRLEYVFWEGRVDRFPNLLPN